MTNLINQNYNSKYTSIAVSGCIARDQLMVTSSCFAKNIDIKEVFNVTFPVKQMEDRLGGNATNLSYGLSFFANKPIRILGSVGYDGQDFIQFFESKNILTDSIFIDNKLRTAVATCLTDHNPDSQNSQIWSFYFGATTNSIKIDFDKYIDTQTLVILAADDDTTFVKRQQQCQDHKIDYVYDCGMMLTDRVDPNKLKQGILGSKFVVVNEYEMKLIEQKLNLNIDQILSAGICIIITKGSNGVEYKSVLEKYFVPSYPTKCVDPVGAGDSWRGGFFGSLVAGKSVLESLIWGNVIASFCVENIGGCAYKPSQKQMQQRFNEISLTVF